MGMEEKIFDKLDGLADRMARIETKHDAAAGEISGIRSDLKNLTANGCAKGRERDLTALQLTDRVVKLEGRPERMLAIIAATIAVFSAASSMIVWMLTGRTPQH